MERNHYNGLKAIHVSFGARKFVVVNLDAKIPLNLLLKTPFHSIVTTKFVPPDLRGDPPKPLGGGITKVVQPIVPYHRPFMRPLNYHEYKKDYDPNVHVRVFKAIIKANNETVMRKQLLCSILH